MLAAGGGSIVLTSSVKGSTGSATAPPTPCPRAGWTRLVRMVATGYGKAGVRCNAVAPGIVATEAVASIPHAQRAELADAHLTPELGTPADIANAVVFLASDLAAFITGQVLPRGWRARRAHRRAVAARDAGGSSGRGANSRGAGLNVVLLGATGKVGGPILVELLERGHRVTAVVRDGSGCPASRPRWRIGSATCSTRPCWTACCPERTR